MAKKTKKKSKVTTKKTTAKSAVALGSVYARAKDVVARKTVDGSVAIMRLDNSLHFFSLEGLSADVWEMLDGKSSLEKIKTKMSKKYPLPEARFAGDMTQLLKDLQKEKLVRLVR